MSLSTPTGAIVGIENGVIEELKMVGTVSSYKWRIKDFSINLKNTKHFMESPVFPIKYFNVDVFRVMRIYPRSIEGFPLDEDSLSILISNHHNWNITSRLTTIILILNNENHRLFGTVAMPFQPWHIKYNAILDATNGILIDDTLTILCETISYTTDCTIKVCDDYETLFENGTSSDVVFTADGKEFNLHKSILMARSPVFQAMFEHSMKENAENVVEIVDVKHEVLNELFRFIYAGKVNAIESIAEDLLVAADKYLVQDLKTMCETDLCLNISVDNVLQYISLASMNNATELKSQAISFFVSNSEDIVDGTEFESFTKSHPDLMCELFRALNQKKRKCEFE